MSKNAGTAQEAFKLLLTTGKPRVHQHIYFGLPIKFIAIISTFVDLLISILPVIFAPPKYYIVAVFVILLQKLIALYVTIVPKLKLLNAYRVLLPRNGCHKLFIKHAFAVCGVLTPVEIICFMIISNYIAFVVSEEALKNAPTAPPPDSPATQGPTKTPNQERQEPTNPAETVTEHANESEQNPLIAAPINDLD